jgi:hypothetical protein
MVLVKIYKAICIPDAPDCPQDPTETTHRHNAASFDMISEHWPFAVMFGVMEAALKYLIT